MNKTLIIALLGALALSSCKAWRKKHKHEPAPVVVSGTDAGEGLPRKNWVCLTGKVSVDLQPPEQEKMSFTASFRMKRDSVIWMSISPGLGFEAARALITRDSVYVLNRLQKEYTVYSFSFIEDLMKTDIELLDLQNILTGNPVFDSVSYSRLPNNSILQFEARRANLKNMITVLAASMFITGNDIYNLDASAQKLLVQYSDPLDFGGIVLPVHTSIRATGPKGEVKADLELNNATKPESIQIPFNIPADYERK